MAYSTLITGPERRRKWSEDEKAALVAAAFAPGAKVAEIARRADICTSLLYRWRRAARAEEMGFARAIVVDAPSSGSEPAMIVEFDSGRRVLIASSAPERLVTAALRALR